MRYVAILLPMALSLCGCDHSWYPEGSRPSVTLGEAELGLPVYTDAKQTIGTRTRNAADATFETKDAFDQVVRFYRERVGAWLKLDVTDRGGMQRSAYGSARNGNQSFEVKLEFTPTGYTRIRLMHSITSG